MATLQLRNTGALFQPAVNNCLLFVTLSTVARERERVREGVRE